MKIIIPGADFSAVKIGTDIDLHVKTISILAQVTGSISDQKKVALDNIVRWIIANGYENSVATMIVPFAAATIPQALRNVWANYYPAFADVSFDPTSYLTLASGAISSVGKSMSDANIKTLVGKSLQNLAIPISYANGCISIAIGLGGNVNAYDQPARIDGGPSFYGFQNAGASWQRGYSASNDTSYYGKLLSYFINAEAVKYFATLESTTISNTTGLVGTDSYGISKCSFCFGVDKDMINKFVCLISGSITDAKLIELKNLAYALNLLL